MAERHWAVLGPLRGIKHLLGEDLLHPEDTPTSSVLPEPSEAIVNGGLKLAPDIPTDELGWANLHLRGIGKILFSNPTPVAASGLNSAVVGVLSESSEGPALGPAGKEAEPGPLVDRRYEVRRNGVRDGVDNALEQRLVIENLDGRVPSLEELSPNPIHSVDCLGERPEKAGHELVEHAVAIGHDEMGMVGHLDERVQTDARMRLKGASQEKAERLDPLPVGPEAKLRSSTAHRYKPAR